MSKVRIISGAQVKELLPMSEAIEVNRKGLDSFLDIRKSLSIIDNCVSCWMGAALYFDLAYFCTIYALQAA